MMEVGSVAVNVIALLTAVFAVGRVYAEITTIKDNQQENLSEIKAMWRKLDRLKEDTTNIRLEVKYIAGAIRVRLEEENKND